MAQWSKNKLNKKIDFFQTLMPFRNLTRDSIAKVTYFFHEIALSRNASLFKEGEECSHWYIVISGELSAQKEHKINSLTDQIDNNIKKYITRISDEYYRTSLKEKYLKEMAHIVSKNDIAKFGPGWFVGDTDCFLNETHYTYGVICSSSTATLLKIK